MTNLSLEQKIGQLFILGFSGAMFRPDHPIVQDINKRNLGGVIIFDRFLAASRDTNNIVNAKQLSLLIASLQEQADEPLLVAVDQEGGQVNRFRKERGFPVTPAAMKLGKSSDLNLTIESAQQTARMLRNVGVNLNLAPVVDLNVYKENPIIGKYGRSFSADPAIVTAHSRAWIIEHRQQGILSCLKHFPGHGSSHTDSHLGFVDITKTWKDTELLPYQHLISENQADSIMLGHLFNRNFDDQYPATLSRATIQTLVRQRLQFEGVVISDDMQMKAITGHYGLEDACCKALAAGVDLLIIGNNLNYDPFILTKVRDAIFRGIDEGTITEAIIEEAWSRIQDLKKSIPLPTRHGKQ
ncbi:MAG: glycoside hydrolase family 3 [Desulforhopalus sp.]|nr:glycoside hydrolase family 3 [Desulforhopalus sp.]